EAKQLAEEKNWDVKEDAGRGWRRVVASPKPQTIVGSETIKMLVDAGAIVIASGGGGIPVIRNEEGQLIGIEAVIDKDSSAFKLAEEVEADMLMILTDVTNAYIHYGKPEQEKLEKVNLADAEKYLEEGHFSVGSMGPKMRSAIAFAKKGGKAVICSLNEAHLAIEGKAGTMIIK